MPGDRTPRPRCPAPAPARPRSGAALRSWSPHLRGRLFLAVDVRSIRCPLRMKGGVKRQNAFRQFSGLLSQISPSPGEWIPYVRLRAARRFHSASGGLHMPCLSPIRGRRSGLHSLSPAPHAFRPCPSSGSGVPPPPSTLQPFLGRRPFSPPAPIDPVGIGARDRRSWGENRCHVAPERGASRQAGGCGCL